MYINTTSNTLVLALDLETSIKGKTMDTYTKHQLQFRDGDDTVYKSTNRPAADPFNEDNYIVAVGHSTLKSEHVSAASPCWSPPHAYKLNMDIFWDKLYKFSLKEGRNNLMLVGVNIGFDFKYLMKDLAQSKVPNKTALLGLFQQRTMLWDLSLVEYLLSGQKEKFPSMKWMLTLNGVTSTNKGDLTSYWDNGIETCDIPAKELLEYLEGDVLCTTEIYNKQLERIKLRIEDKPVFGRLLYDQMKGVRNTNMMSMSCFGLHETKFIKMCDETITALEGKYTLLKDLLIEILDEYKAPREVKEIGLANVKSNSVLSMLIYGESIEYTTYEPMFKDGKVVLYKTGKEKGKPRKKKTLNSYLIKRKPRAPAPPELLSNSGKLLLDEKTITSVLDGNHRSFIISHPKIRMFLKQYLKLKILEKENSTYGIGMVKNLPNVSELVGTYYSMIPLTTEFNHTSTATGRLSSTRINMQNLKGG